MTDDTKALTQPRKRPSRYDDPTLYVTREYGRTKWKEPTQKRAEQLRALWKEHVKFLEPQYRWKGSVEAVVPNDIASDLCEAIVFHVGGVDVEEPVGDDKTRIFSEGYHVHIGM